MDGGARSSVGFLGSRTWWWPWPSNAEDRPGPDRPGVCRRRPRGKAWSGCRRHRSSGSRTASGRRRPRSTGQVRRPCCHSRSCTGNCSATSRCPFPLLCPTRSTTRPTLCTRWRPVCCLCSPTRHQNRPLLWKKRNKNKNQYFLNFLFNFQYFQRQVQI